MDANFGKFTTKHNFGEKLTLANLKIYNVEQSILAKETLANLWSFAKSTNVSILQRFPLYNISQDMENVPLESFCQL